MTDNRCPQCGADRWTVDENAPYCENSWHREATTDDDEPITREWWIETFGDYSEFHEDHDRTIRWPQAGDTWIGLQWILERQRVDIVMGEIDRPTRTLGSWLPHIRTRGQLRGLLEHLVYTPVVDVDPRATWIPKPQPTSEE